MLVALLTRILERLQADPGTKLNYADLHIKLEAAVKQIEEEEEPTEM